MGIQMQICLILRFPWSILAKCCVHLRTSSSQTPPGVGGGDTLGISGWGCAAGTLETLTYTRASSAEFCYPILE